MNKWYEIRNQTQDAADLYFYGDIVSDKWGKWTDDDKCPSDITNMLAECKNVKHLDIYINSNGGSVFGGVAIYNILKCCAAEKTVHIDGVAASIATVIALAGDKVKMPSNAYFMIHNARSIAEGNAAELRKTADDLDKINESIINIYSNHLAEGVDIETIKTLMNDETWLTAGEAAQYFRNITVTEENKAVACVTRYRYKNMPQNVVIKGIDEPPKKEIPMQDADDVDFELDFIESFLKMEESKNE